MKINRGRLALAVVLVFFTFGVLALFYWDFVRDTIALPLYYLFWGGNLILSSIPHAAYLAILVLLGFGFGINSLFGSPARYTAAEHEQNRYYPTRFQHWKTLFSGASIGWYFRNKLALESRNLLLAILAYQEGIEVADVEARVGAGTLPVPPGIAYLIQHKEFEMVTRPAGRIGRLRWRSRSLRAQEKLYLERQIAEVIQFIEHLLEIDHAGSQPESSN